MRAPVLGVPNGQLIGEVAHGLFRCAAEDQARILDVAQVEAPQRAEVCALLAFGAEPSERRVHEHAVEHQQALDRLFDREPAPVAIVGVADGGVQGLVVDVVDARPAVRPEGDEPGVLVRQHAGDEVVDLLPVRDAGEGRVLAADEDA